MSQITTHVLDTSLGKPAVGLKISLERKEANNEWRLVASGTTDDDGRIGDLIDSGVVLESGVFRLTFDTNGYFKSNGTDGFYPEVTVAFNIQDAEHYHVPLLLNPFGYSTYRGS